MIRLLPIVILGAGSALAAEPAVTWKRWELAMQGWPASAAVDVTFSGPAGRRLRAPTFRSGDGTVRARVAFPQAGEWKWEAADTTETAPARRGRVSVTAYRGPNPLYRRGFLRVSANGRYLEHADGTPFLWMGDTVWFGVTRATDAEWTDYLDMRARARFSVVQVSALGTWPKLLPASVPIPQPFDANGAPNPAHWDRIDARVREANEKGLMVALIGLARPPVNADLPHVARAGYARYVAARLFGDHVAFSPDFDRAYQPLFDAVAENLRAHTSIHLITQHPNTQDGQNDLYVPKHYLSFSGLQSGHHEGKVERAYAAAREWPLRLRSLEPVKPVINIEAMYDGRGNDEGPAWRGQDARKLGWISWLSGALGYTFGSGESARKVPGSAGGMWGFNQDPDAWDYWRKAAAWPSANQMTILRDFLAGLEWWRLQPAPRSVRNEGGTALDRPLLAVADDASFGVAYLPAGGAVAIDMTAFASPMEAAWFNPRTAGRAKASAAPVRSGVSEWTAPAGGLDWVLLLRRAGRR
jgi:hypothetical protein